MFLLEQWDYQRQHKKACRERKRVWEKMDKISDKIPWS